MAISAQAGLVSMMAPRTGSWWRILLEEVGCMSARPKMARRHFDRIAVEPFDLVRMDMQMQVMDGQPRPAGCAIKVQSCQSSPSPRMR